MKKENDEKCSYDLYFFIESIGIYVIRFFRILSDFLIVSPIKFIIKNFKKFFVILKSFFDRISYDIRSERKEFKEDVKSAKEKLKKNKDSEYNDNSSEIVFNIIKKHRSFLKHSINVLLPLLALVVLFIVYQYNNNLDFALKVTYNNVEIGYIESEQVFRDAEETIKERLAFGGQEYKSGTISQPKYEISVVHPNEISDSNEICQKIIENSDSHLITACGVYVDGKFICSVKNESDASYVFKNLINDYCDENEIDQNDSEFMVDIIEDITYIQGLYTEKSVMTSEKIEEYISEHSKSESTTYKYKSGDSISSVAEKYDLSEEQIYALNPSLKKDEASAGDKLNVIKKIPFINISVSETQTITKKIKYETEEKNSDSLYIGTTKTVTEGKNGEKKITKLITYVNGKKESEKEIKSVITVEPVNEVIYVGTKPVPASVQLTDVGEGVFIWPTIGADYVTSGFGYRILYDELNFHRGVDISGAGALGQPVIASAAGTVELVTASDTGYGYSVLIDHGNGIKTRYAHCLKDSIIVNVGDTVEQGQMIAQIGSTGNSTGPHLHFEIMYNGAYADPLEYLTR